jgi:RNA recognition motif-containing protein
MSKDRNPLVYVSKLSPNVRESDIESKFEEFGKIRNISIKNGYAFVVR